MEDAMLWLGKTGRPGGACPNQFVWQLCALIA